MANRVFQYQHYAAPVLTPGTPAAGADIDWLVQHPPPTRRRPSRANAPVGVIGPTATVPPAPPTPVTGDRKLSPFIEPSAKPLDTADLLRRITQKLSALVNSLFRQGYIVQTPDHEWAILPAVGRQPRNPAANDDVRAGYYPGQNWINTATQDVYINVDNTAGAAVWVQIG